MEFETKVQAFLEQATEKEKQLLEQFIEGLEKTKKYQYDYLSGSLGITGGYNEDDTFILHMPIQEFSKNKLGIVHGGVISTLADVAMGYMLNQQLNPQNKFAVTGEMKLNFLSPGVGEELIAKAQIVKPGTHVTVTECKIYDTKNKIVAMASATFYIKDGK